MTVTCSHYSLPFTVRILSTDMWVLDQVAPYFAALQLKPSDRVLDIGGYIGSFTVPASKLVQSVDVYEPDPDNYALLVENIRQNRCTNVRSHPSAVVGDRRPVVSLIVGAMSTGHSVLTTAEDPGRLVAATNIDDALAWPGANVVKLDAEGVEVAIIAGITDWSSIDRLVFEYHAAKLQDWDGQLWQQVFTILRRVFPRITREDSFLQRLRIVMCSKEAAG